ncbi:MarR family winged helix-turn-helix transcriptional regulator [Janthinobacterium sp. LB3P118]|jgi:MarR family transcriptional regulator, organic hydroperoxide resistance regulator|uniref:MarR family winged helix-turn-helix transcriptional regulator n=1 Tax=Janthinobacterium sp. LB3P118 TaxID=3424195 RepID=UPI003F2315F1
MVVEAEGSAMARAQGMALQNMRVVMRAAQRHSAQIEKQCGVSGAQLWVMQELLEQPGLRMGELASKISIHQTTASNLVDALVKKAYVRKARDQPDQRVVTLTLTAEGQAVIAGAPQPARGLLPSALAQLDPDSLAHLNQGLNALLAVVAPDDRQAGMQPFPFTM